MKKILILCLSLVLAASTFAGARRESSSSTPASGAQGGGLKYPSLPLVNGRTTLSIVINSVPIPNITSFDQRDNAFTRKLAEETGITLNITNITGAEGRQRLNVMLSAGDYPDIIDSVGLGINDLNYWATQGILRALDGYNATSYPNIQKLLDEYPFLYGSIRGADGKIYALPTIQQCLHCTYGNRVFYHMPWVRDGYGNRTPATLDEFTAYLRYVRDNDVNGNGNRNDEIPLAIDKDSLDPFFNYFAASFLPWVASSWGPGIANDNGRVVDQAKDPAFRNALRYLAGLYQEGLIAPNSFTMTSDELKALLQADTPVVAAFAGAWKTWYMSTQTPRQVESFSLAPLSGPQGVRYSAHGELSSAGAPQWLITDKARDPELAVALYNYLIDFEVMMDGATGPRGVCWDYPDPGAKGMDGNPAMFKLMVPANGSPLNVSWDKAIPVLYTGAWFAGPQTTGVDEAVRWHSTGDRSVEDYLINNTDYTELMWNMIAKAHEQYAVPESYYVPMAILSDDDSTRFSDINAALKVFKDRAYVEFVTGARNINSDSDWNAYLAELDRYGDSELVSILQKYNK
jgi:putative aldouronate transport system substrate-binding protein